MKTTFITGLAIWLWSTSVSAQSSAVLVGTVQEPGLNVTNIETAAGNIKVYLPQNIKAGDRISGTVSAVPNGNNEKELAKNQAYLQGCVVELEDQTATKSKLGILGFIAPTIGSTLFALLRDDKGKNLARFPVPIQKLQIPLDPSTGFEIPILGQNGTALPISGPTDGDLGNSVVQIGNNFYQPIAESPDGMVIRPANDALVGIQPIQVRDGKHVTEGKIRVVSVQMQAPRLNLKRNEMTSLSVRVSGLESLSEPLTLTLHNETPGSVRLANGNTQDIEISASKVKADGTFEITDVIHGFGLGSFILSATVTLRERKLTCGENRDIYTNFMGKDIIVTAEATDECTDLSSILKVDDKRKVIVPDNGTNSATFRVAHGEKITLNCKGAGSGKCTYTLSIH